MLHAEFTELVKLYESSQLAGVTPGKVNSQLTGDYRSVFRGQGMMFDSVRPYVIGDDVRHIDWRVTARTNNPHIKTFEAECDRNIVVAVDFNHYMHFATRGTFKSIQAAKAAAIIAGMGVKKHDRVAGFVFGQIADGSKYFPARRAKDSIWQFFKELSKPAWQPQASSLPTNAAEPIALTQALTELKCYLRPSSLIFLLTDMAAMLEVPEKLLVDLQAKKVELIICPIIDPLDQNLPAISGLTYKTKDLEEITIRNLNNKVIKRYQELWQQQWQQFVKLTNKYKIKNIKLYTAESVINSLKQGMCGHR